MKRTFFVLLAAAMLFSVFSHAQDAAKKSKKMKQSSMDMVNLPYQATYSQDFKIGSHVWSNTILQLYKDYEANDFTSNAGLIADTIIAFLPDGSTIKGKDEVINAFKNMRAGKASSKFTFTAILPAKAINLNENWVALWGFEETTDAADASKKNTWEFQAIWRINRDKKVDFLKIFESKPAAQP
jgi:hypothetical protein